MLRPSKSTTKVENVSKGCLLQVKERTGLKSTSQLNRKYRYLDGWGWLKSDFAVFCGSKKLIFMEFFSFFYHVIAARAHHFTLVLVFLPLLCLLLLVRLKVNLVKKRSNTFRLKSSWPTISLHCFSKPRVILSWANYTHTSNFHFSTSLFSHFRPNWPFHMIRELEYLSFFFLFRHFNIVIDGNLSDLWNGCFSFWLKFNEFFDFLPGNAPVVMPAILQ